MKIESSRRRFLQFGAGAVLLANPLSKALAGTATCETTPAQTPGPFYPGESKFHPDNDLTTIPGRNTRAQGQVIYIEGRVLDPNCQPVAGANVEIWQACASGRYNNPSDPNTAPLDPNFKYWGETTTDKNGEYSFKTIVPGAYPADTNWMRPPHIHFKITKIKFKELITQMYFKGNEYNDKDLILLDVPAAERPSVIIDFQPAPADMEPGSLAGTFDITIQSVR